MDRVLTAGEETFPFRQVDRADVPPSNGILRLTCFTAEKSEAISQIKMACGNTAGVGATLIRLGVYLISGSAGSYTGKLVASIPSDPTLFTATSTAYTKAFTAPFWKTAGLRYAVGLLVVGASTVPSLCGHIQPNGVLNMAGDPAGALYLTGQTDLPAAPPLTNRDNLSLYAQLLP